MTNSKLHNDDTISVIPRIIDPNMKFTKESLELTDSKKNKNVQLNIKEQKEPKLSNNTKDINQNVEQTTLTVGFFSKYK